MQRPDPISDPLGFWARALVRLGLLLLALGLAPMLIDYIFFGGSAALIGLLALLGVAPLGIVFLVIGLIIRGVRRARLPR